MLSVLHRFYARRLSTQHHRRLLAFPIAAGFQLPRLHSLDFTLLIPLTTSPFSTTTTTATTTTTPAKFFKAKSLRRSLLRPEGTEKLGETLRCMMPPSRTKSAASARTNTTQMLADISLTFLGTASAMPSRTRNQSALVVSLGGRGDLWLFDCGEATQHRLQASQLRMGKIKKIFITHTHGDHIFGIGPLLAGLINGAGGTISGVEDPRNRIPLEDIEPMEIYGPLGTRAYVRSILRLTHTRLSGSYVVHEFRFPKEPQEGDYTALAPLRYELPGKNFKQQEDGTWSDIYSDSQISVSAAPIAHSVACVGYVLNEMPRPEKMVPDKYIPHIKRNKAPMNLLSHVQRGEDVTLDDGTVLPGLQKKPGRRITILGDTHDPSEIVPLAIGSDLLVHEATNAYLPGIDETLDEDDTEESVEEKTRKHGHSTPQMAGRFARLVGARRLVLNHFSARYRGDDDVNEEAKKVMTAIKELAMKEFSGEVICARDLMTVTVMVQSQHR